MAKANPSRPRADRPAGEPNRNPQPVQDEDLSEGPSLGERGEYLPASYRRTRTLTYSGGRLLSFEVIRTDN